MRENTRPAGRLLAAMLSLALALGLLTTGAFAAPEDQVAQPVPRGALQALPPVAAALTEEDRFAQWPDPVPEEDRTDFLREDPQQVLAELEARLAQVSAAGSEAGTTADALLEAYEQAVALILEMDKNYAFAYWAYSRDPQANAEIYAAWNTGINRGINALRETETAMVTGPKGEAVKEILGEAYVEAVLARPTYSEAQLAMQEQEAALVDEYYQRTATLDADYTVRYQGKTYTQSALDAAHEAGKLPAQAYAALSQTLEEEKERDMAQLYLELVAVRNAFAQSLGYADYAQYAYPNVFNRDFGPQDITAFCQEVAERVFPLDTHLGELYGYDTDLAAGPVYEALYDLSQEEMVGMIQPHLGKISEAYAQVFQYMLDNDLLDGEALETKIPSAYTMALAPYGSAYLFFGSGMMSAFTLAHEFGHFADMTLAENQYACYDVMEIASQGLEALYFPYVEDMVDQEVVPSAWFIQLYTLLGNVTAGAGVADFERQAYASEGMTAQELCRLYDRINGEQMNYVPWYQIPHVFASPCYYISYATSAANALEILLLSQQDYGEAAERYLDLVAQTDTQGYVEAVEQAGLTNMLTPGALTRLAQGIKEYAYEDIFQPPVYSDVARDNWAYDGVRFAAAAQMMAGTQAGTFAPNAPLTGAALTQAMDKLAKAPEAGWGLEETQTLSREELAACLFRLAQTQGEDTAPRDDLSRYQDAGQVSQENREAVAWAVAEGLLSGVKADRLAPDAPATRAQTAAVLLRFVER